MPLLTIASAIDLIRSSLTLQPNLFQLFQPIGGVSASPPLGAFADWLPCAFATEPIAKKAQTQASTEPHANLFGCFIVSALPRIIRGRELTTNGFGESRGSQREKETLATVAAAKRLFVVAGRGNEEFEGGLPAGKQFQFSLRRQICFDCTMRVHAIHLPSGDTFGCSKFPEPCVNWRGTPPIFGIANNCIRPSVSAL